MNAKKWLMARYIFALAPIATMVMLLTAVSPVLAEEETMPRAAKPLTTAELKSLLSGNSLAGNGKIKDPGEPYDWIAHYGADGVLKIRIKPEWGGGVSKGRWWLLDDGQQCRKFETGHGKEGCWRFYREGSSLTDKSGFLRFVPSSGVAYEGRAVMLPGDKVE